MGKPGHYVSDDAILKLRGLPFDANAVAIVEFFEGKIVEDCIHFIADRPGSGKAHSGEAFLVLGADTATEPELLEYNKGYMGNRYVEVLTSNQTEMSKFNGRLISVDTAYIEEGPVENARANKTVLLKSIQMECNADTVIRIRGLPFECDIAEIISCYNDTFPGLGPQNIVMDKHIGGQRSGQPSGQSFLVLNSPEDREEMLQACRGKTFTVGRRYLEMFVGTTQDVTVLERLDNYIEAGTDLRSPKGSGKGNNHRFNTFTTMFPDPLAGVKTNVNPLLGDAPATLSYSGNQQRGGEQPSGTVKLKGVPFRATKADVQAFISEYGAGKLWVDAEGILLTNGADGRPSGECIVHFRDDSEAQLAKELLHRKHMESRYIEVFIEGGLRNRMPNQGKGGSKGGGKGSPRGNVGDKTWIRLRGLPFDASPGRILQFLNYEYGLLEQDIRLETKFGGQPTGIAFIDLQTGDNVKECCEKYHKQIIGTRWIEVDAVPGWEAEKRLKV